MKFKLYLKTVIFLCISLIFSTSFVYADDIDELEENNLDIVSTIAPIEKDFSINSRAYVVLDRKSQTVLLGKNENQQRKMASTTKIMTATIIIENCNLSETVTISQKAAGVGGSRLGLKTNDKITVKDLLYGLMLKSGNDCAVALAEHLGGNIQNFSSLMNQKALELGLNNTNFETPHGLDSNEHYTTAYELAILSNYAMKNSIFANIVGTKICTVTINEYSKTINNTNELLGNLNGVYGIKTGFTNGANRCLVSCCKRDNMDIICVVLGADTKNFRTKDSINLIEYTFQNFTPINLEDILSEQFVKWKELNENNFVINKGISDRLSIKITNLKNNVIPILKNDIEKIDVQINCQNFFTAPVAKDSVVGEIVLKIDDTIIDKCNIIVNETVNKKSVLDYMFEFLKNYGSYFKDLYFV